MQTNQKKIACSAMLCMAMAAPLTSLADEVRVITCGTLNLRSRPSHTSSGLAELPNGAQVRIYGQWQGWYVVHYGDLVGYAAAAYIDT